MKTLSIDVTCSRILTNLGLKVVRDLHRVFTLTVTDYATQKHSFKAKFQWAWV